MEPPLPQDFSEEDFLSLQKETRRLLVNNSGFIALQNLQVSISGFPIQSLTPTFRSLYLWGSVRDLFLLTVAFLMTRPETYAKIRRCPAPQARKPGQPCGRWFVRERKQMFCSKTCANRASDRKERDTP